MARKKKIVQRDPLRFTPSDIPLPDVDAAMRKEVEAARKAGYSQQRAAQRALPRGFAPLFDTEEEGSPEEGTRLPMPRQMSREEQENPAQFERASRGPASSLPYGKQTDQPIADLEKAVTKTIKKAEALQKARDKAFKAGWNGRNETMPPELRRAGAEYRMAEDEAERLERFVKSSGGLPGMVRSGKSEVKEVERIIINPDGSITKSTGLVARGGGEVVLPAAQKDSPIKREFDRSKRMSYEQAFTYYRGQGYSEQDAKRYAGELLDQYAKSEITRRDVEEISRRRQAPVTTEIETEAAVQTFPGLMIRRGAGGEARSGSEVAREFLNAERRVSRDIVEQRREQDKQGRGLPRVLTRTGPSVFTEEGGTFEPIQEGRDRRFKQKGTTVTQSLTRAQAKALKEANREARRERQQQVAKGKGFYRMSGLGAFDRTTQVLTVATVAALGIGAFLIYRSIQEEKKGK